MIVMQDCPDRGSPAVGASKPPLRGRWRWRRRTEGDTELACTLGGKTYAETYHATPPLVPSGGVPQGFPVLVDRICIDSRRQQRGVTHDGSMLRKEPIMSNNIYVGNLTFNTTSDDLQALFSPHGEVTRATVISDRETGRSRGFGFVEMGTSEEASAAIEALNGKNVDGRDLTVNVAKERSR
jgi:hypothetical protein